MVGRRGQRTWGPVVLQGLARGAAGHESEAFSRQCRSSVRCSAFHRALIFQLIGTWICNMSKFFINRPIFAWLIAIVLIVAGALAIPSLPIAQYPATAPPSTEIAVTYPCAAP